ncbi:MAG: sensor histidine kinase, partial [Chloroflexota bacterium]
PKKTLKLRRKLSGVLDGTTGAPATVALSRAHLEQLRTICNRMRPVALDDLGLYPALEQFILDSRERSGVAIVLDADGELTDGEVSPEIELTLYRAAQEALNNCLRHANASEIRVDLHSSRDVLRLRVTDNGVGFSVPDRLDTLTAQGHLGLVGLRYRIEREGGRLTIASRPGGGTVIQLDLPCAEEDT